MIEADPYLYDVQVSDHLIYTAGFCSKLFAFDDRKAGGRPVEEIDIYPENTMTNITGLRLNKSKSELLVSFGQQIDAKIVLLNVNSKAILREYSGHINRFTCKGVFFGGHEEAYVLTGSDCSNCFIYEKKSGEKIAIVPGDKLVTNCVAWHPTDLVVATSGISSNIRLHFPVKN